jgi:hypothetical protein
VVAISIPVTITMIPPGILEPRTQATMVIMMTISIQAIVISELLNAGFFS